MTIQKKTIIINFQLQNKGRIVPVERLQIAFATTPRSSASQLQPGCYAAFEVRVSATPNDTTDILSSIA